MEKKLLIVVAVVAFIGGTVSSIFVKDVVNGINGINGSNGSDVDMDVYNALVDRIDELESELEITKDSIPAVVSDGELSYRGVDYAIVSPNGDNDMPIYENPGVTELIATGLNDDFIGSDLILPDSILTTEGRLEVTLIGESAFKSQGLSSVIISNNIRYIGEFAFSNATYYPNYNRLGKVIIPDSVKYIDSYAFLDAGVNDLVLGSSVEYIGKSSFQDNELTELIIPKSVTTIEYQSFKVNYFKYVTFESRESDTNINVAAFDYGVERRYS